MYITVSIIVLVATVIYYAYIRPKKMRRHYIKSLREKGYKVAEVPFNILNLGHWGLFKKDEKEKKDAFWTFKHQFQGCDVVVSNILMYPYISILKIDLAKQLFTPDKLTSLHKSELGLSLVVHLSGNSLLMSNDDVWKSKKKILSKVFNYQFIATQIPNIAQICDDAYDKIISDMKSNNEETTQLKLSSLSSNIFQAVISISFFGVQSRNKLIDGKKIQQLILQSSTLITDCSRDLLVFIFGPIVYELGLRSKFRKLKSNILTLRATAKQFIQQINTKMELNNHQDYKCTNILQWLQYLKGKQTNQFIYTEKDVVDQLLIFFAAATDTTTYFFAMIVLFVYENKKIEERLRQQIGRKFDKNEDFTMENLKKMEYIDWLQYQTMRMFGPTVGCFIRRPVTSVKMGGVTFGNESVVNYNCKTNFHDKNIYEDPFTFNPQRWNPQINPNAPHLLNDLLMFGFSGGPRSCIGKQLALIQSKIALIKFVLKFTNVKEVNQRVIGYSFMTYLPQCYIRLQKYS